MLCEIAEEKERGDGPSNCPDNNDDAFFAGFLFKKKRSAIDKAGNGVEKTHKDAEPKPFSFRGERK